MATNITTISSWATVSADVLAIEAATPGAGLDATERVVKSMTGVETPLFLSTDKVHINKNNGDFDFQVDGDTNDNVLFVDASTERVGIGTGTPLTALDVNGVLTLAEQTSTPSGVTNKGKLFMYTVGGSDGKLCYVDEQNAVRTLVSPELCATLVPYNTTITTGIKDAHLLIGSSLAGLNVKSITFSCDKNAIVGTSNTRIITYRFKSGSPVKVISAAYTELLYTDRSITVTAMDTANDDVSLGDIIYFDVTQAGSHKGLFVNVSFGL